MYKIYELIQGQKQYKHTVSGNHRWEYQEMIRRKNYLQNCYYEELVIDKVVNEGRVTDLIRY